MRAHVGEEGIHTDAGRCDVACQSPCGVWRASTGESNVVSHGQGKKGTQEGERAVATMGDYLYKEELIKEGHILKVMETPFLTIRL